jgi:hypothetical protein
MHIPPRLNVLMILYMACSRSVGNVVCMSNFKQNAIVHVQRSECFQGNGHRSAALSLSAPLFKEKRTDDKE